MERKGVLPTVQGGGTGNGFFVPHQIQNESETAIRISSEVLATAGAAVRDRETILQSLENSSL